MIVCSCNVLSDGAIRDCLTAGPDCPRTPAQVYRCLGCRPECGHCARTIRAIMEQALDQALVAAGQACGACPLACDHEHHVEHLPQIETVLNY
jgi:bacterioferritin-associated ferredoxin